MKNLTKALAASILVAACSTQPQEAEETTTQLGVLNHQFPVSAESKAHFDQGLLLLHSFEYVDAREEFEQAIEQDPEELMNYWGLAMTHYRALWGLQDVDAGREVLSMVGDTEDERLAKAETPLEKDFWQGVEILYGEGELNDRNSKYVDHMAEVYKANPTNHEVAAFYSLGLMWAGYDDQKNLDQSARIAKGIIEENPTHPGALHYLIHANDDPEYAIKAINAANSYAKVAPDAAHALHMPSHIYVALGMWKEVVSSNQDSYQASLNRIERKNLSGSARGYHSMAWLHYGYLQQERYDKAAELLEEMIGYHKDSTGSRSYMVMMQNNQRIESGEWPSNLEFQEVNVVGRGLETKSGLSFSKALLAFDKSDVAAIKSEIELLSDHVEEAKLVVGVDGVASCSAGPTRYAPTPTAIKRSNVVIHQMKALAAMLESDAEAIEANLVAATQLEEEAGYDAGPPFIAYPSFEQYGDWLLTQDRAEEALVQFETSLTNRTNRTKALRGKLAALKALGRDQEAAAVEQLILQGSGERIAML